MSCKHTCTQTIYALDQSEKKNYTHLQGAAKMCVTWKTAKIWQKSDYRALTLLTSTTLLGNVQTAQSCMHFDLDDLIIIAM